MYAMWKNVYHQNTLTCITMFILFKCFKYGHKDVKDVITG